MSQIFSEGKRLIEIVESFGWSIYNLKLPYGNNIYEMQIPESGRVDLPWSELIKSGLASEIEIGSNYILIPNPQEGVSLRKAYELTDGFGPSFIFDTERPPFGCDLGYPIKVGDKTSYFFNILYFDREGKKRIMVTTYLGAKVPFTPFAVVPFNMITDVFENHFNILEPEKILKNFEKTHLVVPNPFENQN